MNNDKYKKWDSFIHEMLIYAVTAQKKFRYIVLDNLDPNEPYDLFFFKINLFANTFVKGCKLYGCFLNILSLSVKNKRFVKFLQKLYSLHPMTLLIFVPEKKEFNLQKKLQRNMIFILKILQLFTRSIIVNESFYYKWPRRIW